MQDILTYYRQIFLGLEKRKQVPEVVWSQPLLTASIPPGGRLINTCLLTRACSII